MRLLRKSIIYNTFNFIQEISFEYINYNFHGIICNLRNEHDAIISSFVKFHQKFL